MAYLDEIRNLGYELVTERDEKRAKSFFNMMNWLKKESRQTNLCKDWLAAPVEIQSIQILLSRAIKRR